MPTKFIKTLSEEEHNKLLKNHQTSANFRIQNRSHTILLYWGKFSIDKIAKICRVDQDMVSNWIDNWNEFKFAGLADDEKPSRPTILHLSEQEKAVEIGLQKLKFPHCQLDEIKQATGKEIGKYILKNLLKKKLFMEKSRVRMRRNLSDKT